MTLVLRLVFVLFPTNIRFISGFQELLVDCCWMAHRWPASFLCLDFHLCPYQSSLAGSREQIISFSPEPSGRELCLSAVLPQRCYINECEVLERNMCLYVEDLSLTLERQIHTVMF